MQGSDIKNSDTIEELINMGIKVSVGHNSNNINTKIEKVIYSSAVNSKNPEFIKAKDLNIPIYSRPKYLQKLCKKRSLFVFLVRMVRHHAHQ